VPKNALSSGELPSARVLRRSSGPLLERMLHPRSFDVLADMLGAMIQVWPGASFLGGPPMDFSMLVPCIGLAHGLVSIHGFALFQET